MRIHIIGIAGQGMTTPLALELQRLGHFVTGSDQDKIYPPASLLLRKSHIPINVDPSRTDLVIVGSSFRNLPKLSQEFTQIKQLGIPYISATKYIAQNIVKSNSILVAGTFGKTTITALISWILTKAKFNPSFMIGGQPINKIPPLAITSSDWSVVEADESINGLDTKAKFLYYPCKYVLLTSADWEHQDSYPTNQENLNAFKKLLQNIPQDGFLVYNPNSPSISQILPFCPGKTIPYNFNLTFNTNLIGQHNQENIFAAYTLCHHLGIPDSTIRSAIKSFKGVVRRLQLVKDTHNILFIDDFAQSTIRIESTIKAITLHYPGRPIKVYFEPHASFLQYRSSIPGFKQAFKSTQEVVLGKIKFNPNLSPHQRVTANTFASEVGNKLKYIPLSNQVVSHYQQVLTSGDILLHLSSGGLEGQKIFHHLIRYFSN